MNSLDDAGKTIDKNKVKQSFALAAKSYDGLAGLQRSVGFDFINKLDLERWHKNQQIVDIGCGTGFITQQLQLKNAAQDIVAVDIAFSMLQVTKEKLGNITCLCADAEFLPLLSGSVNHIVSNLALQWCQNLESVFNGFHRVLKKQGTLNFSTFGPDTLKELKFSWSQVDSYQHVNDFYSIIDLTGFLQLAGFREVKIESKIYHSKYSTVLELMRELKGIGAHNVLSGRNKKITSKTDMQNMISAYEKSTENNSITATYEIIFVTASVMK